MTRRAFIRLSTPVAALALVLLLPAGCSVLQARHSSAQTPSPAEQNLSAAPAHQAAVRHVAATDPDLVLFGMDSAPQIPAGQPRPNVSMQQQTFTEVGRDFDPDVDPAGKQVVFASTRHSGKPNLYLQGARGRAVTQLTDDPGSEIQPRFSPDGQRVAFASDRAGQWDIYILDLKQRTTTQLTHNEDNELTPSWSPDGKWLAYSRLSSASGAWELWLVSLEDHAERCIGQGLLPRFSPDGSQIAFQKPRQRDGQLFSIWTMQLHNGEPSWPVEVAAEPDAALICPAWAPDGEHIAFCRVPAALGLSGGASGATARPGQADIYVVEVNGLGRVRLTDGGASFAPCFSNEGRLFFSTDRDGRERIWSLKMAEHARPNMASAAIGEAHTVAVQPASTGVSEGHGLAEEGKPKLVSAALHEAHAAEKGTHPEVVSGR